MDIRHWPIHAYIEKQSKVADLDTPEKRLRALADRMDTAKMQERQRRWFESQKHERATSKRRSA